MTGRLAIRIPGLAGWAAVAILAVLAAVVRFHLPPVAISEWDSWGWLHPALGWIGGAGFHEEYEREWLYGAFIAFGLRLTGSFAGYIVIQQLLGLAAGLLIWTAWRTWISLFPRNLSLEIVSSLAGVAVVAFYLFSPIALLLELSIRPEAIMAFVAFAQLACIVAYLKFRWHTPRPVPAILSGAFAIVLAWALFVLKPNWLLAVPLTTLPVFVGALGRAFPPAPRLLAPALGILLGFLTLWLPGRLVFERSPQTRLVLPLTLFTIHADFIAECFRDELASGTTPADRRAFLAGILPLLDRELENARVGNPTYKRLGFDPDYLMYRATFFPTLHEKHGMERADIAAFCRSNFLSAVTRRPLDYAGKVGRQLGWFAFPDEATFVRKSIDWQKVYSGSLDTTPAQLGDEYNAPTRALYQDYVASAANRAAKDERSEAPKGLRQFCRGIGPWVPLITAAFAGSLLACLLLPPLAGYRLAGLGALVCYGAPFGNALTVSLVHALDNSRYRGSYGPLLVFALAAFLIFIFTTLASAMRFAYRNHQRAKSVESDAPPPGA